MTRLNNASYETVVDSGSSVSLVDSMLMKKLGIGSRKKNDLMLRTANGTELKNEGSVKLKFALGLREFCFNMVVINNLSSYLNGPKMLLGSDFMHAQKLLIDFDDKTVTFRYDGEKIDIPFVDKNHVICEEKVRIEKRVWILNRTVNKVLVRVNVQNGYYVIKSQTGIITFDESLIKVKNNLAWLVVENPYYRKRILYPRQIIGMTSLRVCDPELEFVNWVQNKEEVVKLSEESMMKISVSNELSNVEKNEVQGLIEQYKDCFSEEIIKDKAKFPIKLDFELTNEKPVYVRPYRTNHLQREVIKEEVGKLLKTGVIEPSMSTYSSPFMVIRKADGKSYRCVCDLRKVNELILPLKYPLPNLNSLLEKAQGGSYYSSFDLSQGYHQAEVEPEKRKCLAFSVPGGLYQYRKVPMGLNTSGSFFQMCMDQMFNGLETDVLIYLDDILVVTKGSLKNHLKALEKVLERCRKYGLSLKGSKTKLCGTEIKFLGHYINQNEIRTDPDKINSIRDFKRPENKTEVRSFKGLVNFYARFCPSLGIVSKPLNELCGKNSIFRWQNKHQEAFEKIKELMVGNTVLANYNAQSRIKVYSDASDKGVGGVINIETEEGVWKALGFCSRPLSEHEKKYYSITEKEILGLLFVAEKFKYYLYGEGKVEFFTDHSAIIYLLGKQKELTGRLARWCLKIRELQEYVEIKYKPGKENVLADYMSRNPVKEKRVVENGEEGGDVYLVSTVKVNEFKSKQEKDAYCKEISRVLQDGNSTKGDKRKVKKFQMKKGILYRKSKNNVQREIWQLVVPESMVTEVIELFHMGKGVYHASVNKTINAIQQNYYFKGMQEKVKEFNKFCTKCQLYKESKSLPYGVLTERKFSGKKKCWQLDSSGRFLPDFRGMMYIISMVEVFSGYVVSKAVKNIKVNTMVRFINSVVNKFTVDYIRTDLHSVFMSEEFKGFCGQIGVTLIRSLGFSPHCNGKIEALHGHTKIRLAMKMEGKNNKWSKYLPEVTNSLNITPAEVSKISPYQAMFKCRPEQIDGDKFPIICEGKDELTKKEEMLMNKIIKESQHKQFERNKKYYDKKHVDKRFKVGQLVKVTHLAYEPGINKGFKKKFTGPWIVKEVLGEVTYLLQFKMSNVDKRIHVSRMREFYAK
jgi:hypothetical protein